MSKLISIRIPDDLYEQIIKRAKAGNRTISNQIVSALQDENALRLLLSWAEECDWGFNNFPEECESYIAEAENMSYLDSMIYVAKRYLEERDSDD